MDLNAHFSLFFLIAYVMLVSASQFRAVVVRSGVPMEGLNIGPWASGLIIAVGLFLSIAIHEFGHVWVAKSQGVKVRGVTLMMLGGMSEMEQPTDRKYSEFKLAVIGPVVSLLLGFILFGIHRMTQSAEVGLFTYWLGSANIFLGIFNLMPAFPLDGGRALRSILAARKGKVAATRISVGISKGFAIVLGLVGFLGFNLLMILVAFFVFSAADSELYFLVTQTLLKGVRVKEAMLPVDSLSESETMDLAVSKMLETRTSLLPIQMKNGAGVVSLEQIQAIPKQSWPTTPVGDAVEASVKILGVDEPISQFLVDLATSPYKALPVQRNGRIVGLLRYSDLTDLIKLRSIEESLDDQKKAA